MEYGGAHATQLSPAVALALASPRFKLPYKIRFPLRTLNMHPRTTLANPIPTSHTQIKMCSSSSSPSLALLLLLLLLHLPPLILAASPFPYHSNKIHIPLAGVKSPGDSTLGESKRFEGSSDLVNLRYHMGPVLSSSIKLYLIWYGRWAPSQQSTIRDFLLSISDSTSPSPSVSEWWSTVSLYADQTGANVTRSLTIAGESSNPSLTRGTSLTRLSIQQVISDAILSGLPVDHRNGVYLVFTASGVEMQDFCRAVCGFHYFTFPSMVGHTLPYAWIGYSGRQCPDVCAYPFAVPAYMGRATAAMRPPNGDVAVDGMVSVIAHELAELSTNPLVNAWYAGDDPTAPTEIGDLCEGVYGSGGGGGYTGQVASDGAGRQYNVNGRKGRKFLIQWVWSPALKACAGPNAIN